MKMSVSSIVCLAKVKKSDVRDGGSMWKVGRCPRSSPRVLLSISSSACSCVREEESEWVAGGNSFKKLTTRSVPHLPLSGFVMFGFYIPLQS